MNFPVNLSLFEGNRHSPSFEGLTRSLGNRELQLRDFCIPVNPYFPPPKLMDSLRNRLDKILKYYPSSNESIARDLSQTVGLDPETIIMGNGSTELITWINRLLVKESLAIPIPTFSRWTDEPIGTGKQVHFFQRPIEKNFGVAVDDFVGFIRKVGARSAVLCNPNNPTGAFMPVQEVARLMDELRDLDVVVIDESFVDFVEEGSIPTVVADAITRPNVIVLKSLGKNFGLHGVRMGYAVANPALAHRIRKALPFWNLNAMAEFLIADLKYYMTEYEESRRRVVRDRIAMENALCEVSGLEVFPSYANFIYVRLPLHTDGTELRNFLLTEYGYLLRECGNKAGSSNQYMRIAARPKEEQQLLVAALHDGLAALKATRGAA